MRDLEGVPESRAKRESRRLLHLKRGRELKGMPRESEGTYFVAKNTTF